jgi:hypothetical protein
MKQIHALYFKLLPFAAHFDFFKKLSAILTAASSVVKTALAALTPDFNAWLAKEDAVMDWVRKSALTAQIADADREIDRLLTGINAVLDAVLHSPYPVNVAIANRVHLMVKSYGRVANKSYDEEAGDVRAMLEQFNGPFFSDMSNVGLAIWVSDLQLAFNRFETLLRQRETEQGEKPPYTAREVRKGIEEVYYQMVRIIDANATVGTAPDFGALIDLLNPNIDRLNEEFHRARKDISVGDHTVVDSIPTQTYTEKPITPIPKVYYREDDKPTVELVFATDFSLTYKNNTNVGTAEVTIHGKGSYKGQFTVKFNIARV